MWRLSSGYCVKTRTDADGQAAHTVTHPGKFAYLTRASLPGSVSCAGCFAPLCIKMLYQFHPPLWQRLVGNFLELRAQRVPKQIEQRWSS